MLGVFAEFERAMIVERVHAGLKRARAQGKRLGRPRVAADVERRIRELLAKGRGISKRSRWPEYALLAVRGIQGPHHAQP
jgi:DNA invertase Pin-like site-specific DNA recombinase